MLFLTNGNANLHNKMYSKNKRDMLDHEGNITEKEDGRSCIVDAIVVPEKMECADFVGETETIVVNSSIENTTLNNSDLLVKENKEYRSAHTAP